MSAMKAETNDIEKLAKLAKDVQFAMFTTHSSEHAGELRSRPMTLQQAEFLGDFWFFVGKNSAIARDITANSTVNLSFSQPKGQEYVSASGQAELSMDRKKIDELWNPLLKAWFPEGKEDPELALLCVHVERADYWEAPDSKIVQLYGFAKAVLTGQRPSSGEIGKRGHVQL